MARGLLDLANDMYRLADRVDDVASEAAVEVTRAIIKYLAYHTPVDTSQALSNWQVSFNAPIQREITPHYSGVAGSTQGASAEETIRLANEILRNKVPGATIYIVNRLPYIQRLEDGYSLQAPAGFMAGAMLMGRITLREFKFRG